MDKKRNPFILWIAGLAVAALLLTDMLPMFVQAREAVVAAPVAQMQPGRIEVAQAQQQQPRKRKTLMDLLFGDKQEEPPPPVVEKPVVRKARPAVAKQPEKPKVEKAPGATRLAVFGDSMALDIGRALERFFTEDPNIVVQITSDSASGFVRPDHFDWPKRLSEEIAKNSFDIAVVAIGVNDRQTLRYNGEGLKSLSPEWITQYSARVSGFVQQLRAANKPTIWVGLPPMEAPTYAKAMIQINEIQRLAAFGGGAEFLDVYDRFLNEEGTYSSHGPDLSGARVRMRKEDGIHYSAAGADKLAFYLSQVLKTYYRGGGTVGIEVADALVGTDAQMMVRPPYQGLGQMKLLEVAGAVISLTHTQRRAAELVTAATASLEPVGFDMSQLMEAPVGRADAFGVGKLPGLTASRGGR